jgi:hypothetical protein
VPVVHGVEPDQCGEEPDVGLGDRVAHQVPPALEPGRQPVEPIEQGEVGALVRPLRTGEPGPGHAVVDVAIDDGVDLVDLVAEVGWVEPGSAGRSRW